VPDGGSRSFRADLDQLNAEAGGAFNAVIIDPAGARGLLIQAAFGDRQAKVLFRFFAKALAEPGWHDGSRLCGLCDHSFREPPSSFFLLLPLRDDPGVAITTGLCGSCDAGSVEEIIPRIWPGLRRLDRANLHRGVRHGADRGRGAPRKPARDDQIGSLKLSTKECRSCQFSQMSAVIFRLSFCGTPRRAS
jgi:hypothetical protein